MNHPIWALEVIYGSINTRWHLTWYVFHYFSGLMTTAERLAYGAFLVEWKGKNAPGELREKLLDLKPRDPEALRSGRSQLLSQIRWTREDPESPTMSVVSS